MLVRQLVAPNPSLMTGPGTNTWLIGRDRVAVVDPGPAMARHIDAIIEAAGAPIRWILATHTHPDHSPGTALLRERTGAEVLGMSAPGGEHQDTSFVPDRVMADGDTLATAEFSLAAVHTPGHASNHLCFLLEGSREILTGDHVIDGSTVVINPPDGDMQAYIESLRKLRELRPVALLPGHGSRIEDPLRVIDGIIEHRLQREAGVFAAVCAHPGLGSHALVAIVYAHVPERLHRWAQRSLLAHLLKLEAEERVRRDGEDWFPA